MIEIENIQNILEEYGISNFLKIFMYDKLLCLLFGKAGRWYQLHCLINLLITIDILPSVIEIITDPYNGYKLIKNNENNNMVISMHLYHMVMFTGLNLYDWMHHIVFVLLGVLPGMIYVKSNQLYLHKIACSGIPGVIEYGTLTLYKNNRLSKINQKYINTLLYVYFRLPLCILGVTMNYMAYKEELIKDPLWITLYANFLLYLNGTVFTFLTVDSYCKVKYLEKKKYI
tara:strand:- start:2701 stop:3387 length:687 start_codon:yes stop_codon:yes gene_type:complete